MINKVTPPIDWEQLVALTNDQLIAHRALRALVKEAEELIETMEKIIHEQTQDKVLLLVACVHKLAGAARHSMACQLMIILFDMEKDLRITIETKAKINWKKTEKFLHCLKKEFGKIQKYVIQLQA